MFKSFSKKPLEPDSKIQARGVLVFENTTTVIRAETLLKNKGWEIKVMGPPPFIRTGCDLVIEFPLMDEMSVIRALSEKKIKPLQVLPVSDDLLEPVSLFQDREYGKYLMVRAANMKITVDRETNMIVNVSGGGCPDVPYLAGQMVNKHLNEAPQPKEIGHTLCAYALQLAFERVVKICSE